MSAGNEKPSDEGDVGSCSELTAPEGPHDAPTCFDSNVFAHDVQDGRGGVEVPRTHGGEESSAETRRSDLFRRDEGVISPSLDGSESQEATSVRREDAAAEIEL